MKRAFINPKTFIAALLLSGAVIAGCSDDESFSAVDNQNPVVALEAESIHWEFGKEFKIKAKIDDADGIKTINLKNADLMLNNTIDILSIKGSECKSYELDYKFTAPDSLKTETFPIVITVEDLVGNVSSVTFTANMDGDFTNPKFTVEPNSVINVIMSAFNFKFSVSDNRKIKRVVVNFPDLNINEEITNETKTYDYVKNISLGDENRDYTGYIAAYDEYDNEVKKEITISRGELADYERMYLCDVAEEDLITDVCGVPMLIDHSGEFEYTAYYYNEKAGTEIRFIPQKASYEPVCFGLDPDSGDKLNSDPSQAKPLVLNETGVYYKIVFNTKQLTYSTSTYSVDKAVNPMPHELGKQEWNHWEGGSWNKETGKWEGDDIEWRIFEIGALTDKPNNIEHKFETHPQNKNIIQILNCQLEKGSFEFHPHIVHTDEWWDYASWKPEKATENDPEIWKWVGKYTNPKYNQETTSYNNNVEEGNHAKLKIPKTGNYDIIFDTHLGRMKVVPSK